MSVLDSAHNYTTEQLLHEAVSCTSTFEERLAAEEELKARYARYEQHRVELQAANTELTLRNRELRNGNPVWDDVIAEQQRARRKHGEYDYTDFERLSILTEELGEVAQKCCQLYVPPIGALMRPERERANLREELVQVTAVGKAWIEAIDAQTADSGGAGTHRSATEGATG